MPGIVRIPLCILHLESIGGTLWVINLGRAYLIFSGGGFRVVSRHIDEHFLKGV